MNLTSTLLLGLPVELPRGTLRTHWMRDDDRLSQAEISEIDLAEEPCLPPVKGLHNGTRTGLINRAAVIVALRSGPATVQTIAKAAGLSIAGTYRRLKDLTAEGTVVRQMEPVGKAFIYQLS